MNIRHLSLVRLTRVAFAVALFLTIFLLLPAKDAAAQSTTIFIPLVSSSSAPVAPPQLTTTGCDLNEQEVAISEMAKSHPSQQREFMVCNPILSAVAREKALDMAHRGYFGHTNPEGIGANKLVRDAGYPLPGYYASNRNSNNIESLAGGYATPEDAWVGWMASEGHRTHILGQSDFYGQQVEFGVGYAYVEGSTYGHHWVFFSAYSEDAE